MVTLLILSIFCIVAVAGWTYFLCSARGVSPDPSATFVQNMQGMNDRMLLMVRETAQREQANIDRLFSAANGMQRMGELSLKQAMAMHEKRIAGPSSPPPPMAEPSYRFHSTKDDEDVLDDVDEHQAAIARADQREVLQDAGVLGVPAGDI